MRKQTSVSKIGRILCLAALLLGSLLSFSAFAEGEMAGDGTEQNPYIVMNEEQLVSLGDMAQPIGYVRLGSDLDMSKLDPEQFPTVTAVIPQLSGVFYGDGHTIKNLTLKGGKGSYSSGEVNTGLIGELSGTVRDLKMTGVAIEKDIGTWNNVGSIAGRVAEGASAAVKNCIVTGNISYDGGGTGSTQIGGLVGMINGTYNTPTSLTVEQCVSGISIIAKSSAQGYGGGILGSAQYYSTVTVDKCAILGAETDGVRICVSDMGNANCGVVGYINSGSVSLTLKDSYLGAKVSGSKKYGIAYTGSFTPALSVTNFHYDSTVNPSPSAYSSFEMLNKGTVTVTANTTEEIQLLSMEGFEVREDEFGKYPVPVWSPLQPSAPQCENGIRFEGSAAYVSAKEAGAYTVVFAAYQNEQLSSVSVVTQAFAAGENQAVAVPADFRIEGADTVRAMFFRSLADLYPMADAAPYLGTRELNPICPVIKKSPSF